MVSLRPPTRADKASLPKTRGGERAHLHELRRSKPLSEYRNSITREPKAVKSIKDLKLEIEMQIKEIKNKAAGEDYSFEVSVQLQTQRRMEIVGLQYALNLLNSFEAGLRKKLEAVKLGHPGYTTDPNHPSGQHKQGWLEALRLVLGEEDCP